MNFEDTYKTIVSNSEPILYKEKNSKFFGYAFHITSEEAVKQKLELVKKEHHSARHWCYAYQIGTESKSFRVNDDGEPSNTAGMPIYGQILSSDLTNVLIIVVRYFGGVKLGVGGLIKSYRTTAQLSIEASEIIEKTVNQEFEISFEYKDMNKVMRIIKEKNLDIISQKLELACSITISVRKQIADRIFDIFVSSYGISIKKVEN